MSGLRASTIVQYGADRDGTLLLWRRAVWPMLRTIPNNTGASLQQAFGPADLPPLSIDGKPLEGERLTSATIAGTLALRTKAPGLELSRTLFPSREQAVVLENVSITNRGSRSVAVTSPPRGLTATTDAARGVSGAYIVEAATDREVNWRLAPGETRSYAIVYSARRSADPPPPIDPVAEHAARTRWVASTGARMILETPNPILNRAFGFAKVRATESIFATKGGLMHGPGGGRYYAAIWANDQAEYANPFFAFLGAGDPRDSALNAFRHFARFMNPDYKPIPSSIIAEGTGTWNGAGDRGDQAMIAYGAARFALASGDRTQAAELWPLIEWCLEYLERKTTLDGVIASDSDELENRFPSGKANLNTASLTYDALLSAAMLGESLGKPRDALDRYRARAGALRDAIEKHFAARIDGFETYRYYDGNTTLRAWIATPLTVGIYRSREGHDRRAVLAVTVDEGRPRDRSWQAGLLGSFHAVCPARGVCGWRHQARPRSADRILVAPSARRARSLCRRGVSRGRAGPPVGRERALLPHLRRRPVRHSARPGLDTFAVTPRLPDGWDRMSLRAIHAFGRIFDVEIRRAGANLQVRVVPDRGANTDRIITPGGTVAVSFD